MARRSAHSSAIVVGGGIGGLTAAIALRRAGVDAIVFERASDLRHVQQGGAIHLWHNGMRGLQRLGLAERVEQLGGAGAVLEQATFTDHAGKRLFDWSVAETARRLEAPTVGVVRPALHRVLVEALPGDAVRLGSVCTGFSEDETGVTARFENGHEERADVLIGADGLHSALRAQLLRDGEPRYAGYVSYQGFAAFPNERAPVGLLRVLYGRGARFLSYHVADERLYWEGIVRMPLGAPEPQPDRQRSVLESFRGWNDPVEAIVEATDASAITRTEIFTRPPSKRWGSGRVTLLGDAAHPMTNAIAQGASQAIEDGVVLATCLQDAVDPAAALRDYEHRRIPRTAKMVRISWNLSRLAQWRSPPACALRSTLLRLGSKVIVSSQTKDMDYRF